MRSWNLPVGQVVQTVVWDANSLPAAQNLQAADASSPRWWYLPGSQAVQAVDSVSNSVPAAQNLQVADASSLRWWYLPAGQSVHAVMLQENSVPAAHALQPNVSAAASSCYAQISTGSCASHGHTAITSASDCEAAVAAVNLAEGYGGERRRPQTMCSHRVHAPQIMCSPALA